jgi:allantoicase
MDGWESRRRRLPGYDWAILRLGLPGYIHGVEIDTAHFTGNQTPQVRLFGAELQDAGPDGDAWLPAAARRESLGMQGTASTDLQIAAAADAVAAAGVWHELVTLSPLRPGYGGDEGLSIHRFEPAAALKARRVTHLRLNQHPDGGIARLRTWGVAACDWATQLDPRAVGAIDLNHVRHGATAVGCSNKHFGEPRNLQRPGRGENMGSGWETARNPNRPAVMERDPASGFVRMPGVSDWSVLRLGAVAEAIESLVVDTHFFKGNYPESVSIEAVCQPDATAAALLAPAGAPGAVAWRTLLPRVRVGPNGLHDFASGTAFDGKAFGPVSHIKVSIYPDGGVMRVRAIGKAKAPMPPLKVD